MTQNQTRVLLASCAYSLCALLLLIGTLVSAHLPSAEPYSLKFCLMVCTMELLAVGLPVLFFFLFPVSRAAAWPRTAFGKPPAAIWLLIPISLLGYFCTNGLTMAWLGVLNLLGPVKQVQSAPIPQTNYQFLWGVLVIGLCPALIEELLFRGVMQNSYARALPPLVTCLVVGVLFACMHGQILALPAHIALGVLLCLVMLWSKNIWCGMLLHFLQNSLAIGIGLLALKMSDLYEQMGMAEALNAEQELLLSGGFTTIFSGAMVFAIFLIPLAALLALFWYLTKKQRAADTPAVPRPETVQEDRPSLLHFLPLLPGLLISLFLYINSILATYGLAALL